MTDKRVVDHTKPGSARIYDYFLGGKDNYEVDREAAAKILEVWPAVASGVHAQNRNRDEVARFFDNYALLDPGVVGVHRWRPESDLPDWRDAEAGCWAGIARKN